MSAEMRVAVIGCGEVGRCYASALAAHPRYKLLLCDAKPAPAASELADRIGSTLHDAPGPWLNRADLVISSVFGGVALEVFRAALPNLAPGAIYADFTTAAPADKKLAALEAAAESKPISFVDVVIMGGISTTGIRSPLICVGDNADFVRAVMTEVGAPIEILADASVGDATALKLLRSIFTKGTEALAVECLVAAEHYGMRRQLYESLADFDRTPIRQRLETLLRTHVIHARRRAREVSEAEGQVRQAGLQPRVLPGVRALFEQTVAGLESLPVNGEPSTEDALLWLLQNARRQARACGLTGAESPGG